MISLPEQVSRVDEDVSRLFWDKEDEQRKNGRYFVRGGICFPSLDKSDGRVRGFAIAAGKHLQSGSVLIFAEKEFVSIPHILGTEGQIIESGSVGFFNEMWSKLGLDAYYYHQDDETAARYMTQGLDCAMLQPKPFFCEINWKDDFQAQSAYWSLLVSNKLFFEKESLLYKSFSRWNEGEPFPKFPVEVRALLCALTGIERYQYDRMP